MEHRYILEPYKGMSTRHRCPACNQKGKFTLYIDTETNLPIANHVGKCERLDKCNYHMTPKQYFEANGLPHIKTSYIAPIAAAPKTPSFIDNAVFAASLKNYNQNNFFTYLTSLFDFDKANELAAVYHLGTSRAFDNACVFWQVDLNTQIHTGKIMGYDPNTGKRIKEPFDQINWAHKALNRKDFELQQCLFGLHLLADKTKAIAVVESEKTAIIASEYLPQFIWLATSGKTQFTKAKLESLKGRKVVLYPDLGGFEDWQKIANENGFACSDLLERKATAADKKSGLDLADYLIREQLFKTRTTAAIEVRNPQNIEIETPETIEDTIAPTKPANVWLVPNFVGLMLPKKIVLNAGATISNVKACIGSHLSIINSNNGNKAYLVYLKRLTQIHQIIQQPSST